MQHNPLLPIVRETLRYKICRECARRPVDSQELGPREARSCEGGCPIFKYMNELVGISATVGSQRMVSADHLIADHVCDHCILSPTAGDYCARRLVRTCPLTLYGMNVIEVIEKLLAQHAKARHGGPVLSRKR